MRNIKKLLIAIILLAVPGFKAFAASAQNTSSGVVENIIENRVEEARRNVGMAIGIITREGQDIYFGGERLAGSGLPISRDTIFEIGSLTKVFTAVLLADMVARGEVSYSDPISNFLPADVALPEGYGERITLVHLVTHTAGFGRNPTNADENTGAGVFATYTEKRLYDFLETFKPISEPGVEYAYSNIGMGLLGYLLARRAGMSLEDLFQARIFRPLGMTRTHLVTPLKYENDFAVPHNGTGEPIPRWDFDVLAGAGAIRSTIPDMLKFAKAALGLNDSSISSSIQATYRTELAIPGGDNSFFPGWIFPSVADDSTQIFWHDGGTGGTRSFLGLINNDGQQKAAVVLSNTAFPVNDIGLHLLDKNMPLREVVRIDEITLKPAELQRFTGQYKLSEEEIIFVTSEDGVLYVEITGDKKYPVYPYQEHAFFYKVADAQLIFEIGENDQVISVILQFQGSKQKALKLE